MTCCNYYSLYKLQQPNLEGCFFNNIFNPSFYMHLCLEMYKFDNTRTHARNAFVLPIKSLDFL